MPHPLIFISLIVLSFSPFAILYIRRCQKKTKDNEAKKVSNKLNYEFLSSLSKGDKIIYLGRDDIAYAGCECITNSPKEHKMICQFSYNNNTFSQQEILKYSDVRLRESYILNKDDYEAVTILDFLNEGLEVLEVSERYEEAAVIRDAIIKIEQLTTDKAEK